MHYIQIFELTPTPIFGTVVKFIDVPNQTPFYSINKPGISVRYYFIGSKVKCWGGGGGFIYTLWKSI